MSVKSQIEKAISKIFSSGKAEEFIKDAAEKAVKDSIDNAFRSYGKVGKQIESMLEEALQLDMANFNLQSYNHSIAGMVQKLTLIHLEQDAQRVISERLSEMLTPVPKEITVQDMVDRFIESWKDYGDFSIRPEIDIQKSAWSEESCSLKLWKDGRHWDHSLTSAKREKEPEVNIYVYKGRILIPHLHTGVFSSKQTFEMETFIYLMAVGGTLITDIHEVTADDIDLEITFE